MMWSGVSKVDGVPTFPLHKVNNVTITMLILTK